MSARGSDPKTLARRKKIEEERKKECTFQPQLYSSSSTQYLKSCSGGHKSIYERQLAWQRRKEDAIESKRLELEKEKEIDCTFRPMTSQRTESFLGELGGLSSSRVLEEERVVNRLYDHGVEQKRQLQAQLRERLNKEIEKICTFKPQVNPSGKRDPTPVRSRYMDITPRKNVSMEESHLMREEKELLECTFKPRVNKPSNEMQVAKEYLSEPAWLRLSRPRPVSPQVSTESSTNMSSNKKEKPRPASAPKSRPNTSVSSESSFDAFLERQEQFVRRMEFHMAQKRQQSLPTHPRSLLSERSKRLIDKKVKKDPKMAGSFLDRLEAMIDRREQTRREQQEKADGEHSFKPKINRASRELRGRSWHEMSYGDMTRQGEAQLTVKRDVEYRNTSLYTYKPQLNAVPGVESRLKISSDPHNYLARVEHEQRRAQQEQSRTAQELREKELEECTFQPLIHEAPEFVKRIAQTHKRKKMVEAMRKQASIENVHPDWNSSVAVEEKKAGGVRRAQSFA
uniref:Uncharacterized protein n=1 Tax=Guillardia theta TaxID=55529 RepID=A0A7S4L897_GUITH